MVHVKSSVDYESTQITEEITQRALKVLKMGAVRKRNVRSDRREHVCVLGAHAAPWTAIRSLRSHLLIIDH